MLGRRRKRMKIVTWIRSEWKLGWELRWNNWSEDSAEVVVLVHDPKRKQFRVHSTLAVCSLFHAYDVTKQIAARVGLPMSARVAPGWTMPQLVLYRLKGGD